MCSINETIPKTRVVTWDMFSLQIKFVLMIPRGQKTTWVVEYASFIVIDTFIIKRNCKQ